MKDTRETLLSNMSLPRTAADNEMGDDIDADKRPPCRFKVGDELVAAYRDGEPFALQNAPYWDREFQGWLIAPGFCGVHESNFILSSERAEWEPHSNDLWSWWERKTR